MGRTVKIWIGSTALALAGVGTGLASLSHVETAKFRLLSPSALEIPIQLVLTGRVLPASVAPIESPIAGRIERWLVPAGSSVRQGQPIAIVSVTTPDTAASQRSDDLLPVRPFVDRDLSAGAPESAKVQELRAKLAELERERMHPSLSSAAELNAARDSLQKANDELATLERQASVVRNQAETAIADAQADLAKVQAEYERIKSLIDMGAVAENRIDPLESKLTAAKARVSAAKDALASISGPDLTTAKQQVRLAENRLRRAQGAGGDAFDDEISQLNQEIARLEKAGTGPNRTVEIQPIWGSTGARPIAGRIRGRRAYQVFAPASGTVGGLAPVGSNIEAGIGIGSICDDSHDVLSVTVDRATAGDLVKSKALRLADGWPLTELRIHGFEADADPNKTTVKVDLRHARLARNCQARVMATLAKARTGLFVPADALEGERITMADGTVRIVRAGVVLNGQSEILEGLQFGERFRTPLR